MVAEVGHLTLWLALGLALIQALLPLWGAWKMQPAMMALARPAAKIQFLSISISLLALAWAFYFHDYSLRYVAEHANSRLPVFYRISAIWGGHEGSLLLWVWMLSAWGVAVSVFSKSIPAAMQARVLSVMAFISIGFLAFMLFTSNPFDRNLPWFPLDGADLNPLLQDPGLIVHPPMLYMGYVGFSVAFSIAIAGLLGGRFDQSWARWARPWTTVAWSFLTVGIALGSWWAYYELGWGGWWFWDPVENASLMPWLAGTALVHSLAVTEKRGLFRAWTVLLAILAFSLSLLGTFLVRSGILTSVHAFANDPERGTFVLIFLMLVSGGAFALFGWRASLLRSSTGFRPMSRETFLLMNNLLLLTATFVVLFGTLFPLFAEAVGARISIRSPYFNAFTVPLTLLLMVVMAPGVLSQWKKQEARKLLKYSGGVLTGSVIGVAVALGLAAPVSFWGVLAWALAMMVVVLHLQDALVKGLAFRRGVAGLARLSRSYWGMVLAHCGLAVLVAGVATLTSQEVETEVRLAPGEQVSVAGYDFQFEAIENRAGPNYTAIVGRFIVSDEGQTVTVLEAEKRTYLAGGQVMTEAAIDAGLLRDLYIAMGEPLENNSWALRIYVKPAIRWIWGGALMLALGGLLAVSDRRYRARLTLRDRASTEASSEVETA